MHVFSLLLLFFSRARAQLEKRDREDEDLPRPGREEKQQKEGKKSKETKKKIVKGVPPPAVRSPFSSQLFSLFFPRSRGERKIVFSRFFLLLHLLVSLLKDASRPPDPLPRLLVAHFLPCLFPLFSQPPPQGLAPAGRSRGLLLPVPAFHSRRKSRTRRGGGRKGALQRRSNDGGDVENNCCFLSSFFSPHPSPAEAPAPAAAHAQPVRRRRDREG